MKIKYLGHSSFLLVFSNHTRIVCDPYEGSIGFSMPKVEADIITLSHHHYDHDYISAVSGKPQVLDGFKFAGGKVCGIDISAVPCYHDEVFGAKRGRNTIFTFEADGVKVCHLGDLGEKFSEKLVEKIKPCDVLLIPVGGTYTIDYKEALKYVKAIGAKVVIPMHYKSKGCLLDIDSGDRFLNEAKKQGVPQIVSGSQIEINAQMLSGDTKIVFMQRAENEVEGV